MWQEVSPKGKGAADVRRRGGGRLGMQKEQISVAVPIEKAEHQRIDAFELWSLAIPVCSYSKRQSASGLILYMEQLPNINSLMTPDIFKVSHKQI